MTSALVPQKPTSREGRGDALVRPAETIDHLRDATAAYPAWLAAIADAKEEILLEMYWFASDKTGWKFADALAAKAREGVDVRVLYDAIGSLGTDRELWDRLVHAGVRVIEHNPIRPWRRRFTVEGISRRDHRKILVVDDVVAFTGGINITDAAAPVADGGEGWRDDAVRVTGFAAEELRRLFFDTWLRSGGGSPRRGGQIERRDRLALIDAARDQARLHLGLPEAPHLIQVIGHAARGAHRVMRKEYLLHIRRAKERILIANAYFIPDAFVRRALQRAARRGVEVRVIVPEKPDVPSVAYASSAMWARLMRAGVHIHLWTVGMIHAKTAVIDGWATVGSYNLDYRSLLYNLEVNVATNHPGFVETLAQSFRTDLGTTRVVDRREWRARPFGRKILEWIFYRLRKLL
jgi:cardiolipin synthase